MSGWSGRCHLTVVALCVTAAFLLRFDFSLPADVIPILKEALLIAILVKLPVFDWSGFYRSLRRFVSIPDLYLVFLGNLAGSVLFAALSMFWIGPAMPRSVLIIDAILCFVATALVRFSVRIRNATFREHSGEERTGILIYGAGSAGAELVREIHANRFTRYEVKGFLDDDPLKQGARIMGIPVLGSGREAVSVVRQLNRRKPTVGEIIIAMPSATGAQMRETLANCRAARIPCKTVPGIDELLSGRVLYTQVRNPAVQDLLGRQQVRLDEAHVQASIAGRSVMVTGAAGSIGSEICRQVARFQPARLIAFDQAESDLFRIENELREKYPELELVTALGNIRETDRLSEVMLRNGVESDLPRGGVQACAHDGVARPGGGSQQRSGDLEPGARGSKPQRAQPADDLFRQGGEPDLRDGRNQTRLRADRLRALAGATGRHAVSRCALETCWAATAAWSPCFRRKLPRADRSK